MPRGFLLCTTLILALLAPPAWAADDPPPPPAPSATNPSSVTEPAKAFETGSLVQPTDAGLAQEFAERLAVTGSLSAADREDRSALQEFYAARRNEPVWIGAEGLAPAGDAVVG